MPKIESFGISRGQVQYDLGGVFVCYGGKMTAKVSKRRQLMKEDSFGKRKHVQK